MLRLVPDPGPGQSFVESRTRDHHREYLTPDEMAQLLKATDRGGHGLRDHLMLLLAYRHGLRVSEMGLLQRTDVDLSSGHAQRFLAAYGPILSHFRPRRHRLPARAYRQEMTRRFHT